MTPTASPLENQVERKDGYSLSQLAYLAVSEAIYKRRLQGGEMIVEGKLSEALGVSRTPLREALQRLEGEGMVVKVANRSFMVRNVDFSEYLQSLKVRELLEAEAAALAINKIPPADLASARAEAEQLMVSTTYHTEAHWHSDDTVHGIYIKRCGNAVLGGMIDSLRGTTRLFELANLADRLQPDSVEHLAIIDGLASRDPKQARRAVQAHMRSLQRFALQTVAA